MMRQGWAGENEENQMLTSVKSIWIVKFPPTAFAMRFKVETEGLASPLSILEMSDWSIPDREASCF